VAFARACPPRGQEVEIVVHGFVFTP